MGVGGGLGKIKLDISFRSFAKQTAKQMIYMTYLTSEKSKYI